jgi:hypothetical protein
MYYTPGADNSILIRTKEAVPIRPEKKMKIKYKVLMSLALEDPHHLSNLSIHFFLLVVKLAISNLSVIFFLLVVKLAILYLFSLMLYC